MNAIGIALISLTLCRSVVMAYNSTEESTVNNNLCSIRYDISTGPGVQLLTNKTCSILYTDAPTCNANLTILYYDIPPYMFSLPDGEVDGIIPGLLNTALATCCLSCTNITYLRPFKSLLEANKYLKNELPYSIMMPALSISTTNIYFGRPYVKLMNTPGVVYLHIDESDDMFMEKLMSSVAGSWPLLVLVILLTIEGGVIIWLLDQRKNPDEFPRSFLRGAIEGSWWAYVSMTTVGYGDKAPRSIQGRVFAVFWITNGVVISGMFTASISSSLTSAIIPGKTSLHGLKVGYLRQIAMAYEENIIFKEGGKPILFEDLEKMIDALRKENINGILMDSLVYRYHKRHFDNSGLELTRTTDVPNSDTSIGMMFAGSHLQSWADFLAHFFRENKDAESRILKESITGMKTKFTLHLNKNVVIHGAFPSKVSRMIVLAASLSTGIVMSIGIIFALLRNHCDSRARKRVLVTEHELEMKKGRKSLDDQLEEFSQTIRHLEQNISTMREDVKRLLKDNN